MKLDIKLHVDSYPCSLFELRICCCWCVLNIACCIDQELLYSGVTFWYATSFQYTRGIFHLCVSVDFEVHHIAYMYTTQPREEYRNGEGVFVCRGGWRNIVQVRMLHRLWLFQFSFRFRPRLWSVGVSFSHVRLLSWRHLNHPVLSNQFSQLNKWVTQSKRPLRGYLHKRWFHLIYHLLLSLFIWVFDCPSYCIN